ncbi:MAG TPA: cyclic 2,3-diphosphoglycerate synthase [Myxococcota bacterium]|nr:cyclic 2,3-diphosphoglycerate synthase [Myxococcota bacterium]HRY94148.1 cyclic 2,3-diphosphoglycerate synthase [Myxococcota bacterium]HSA21881.1 cyclic 2,3-diphosphoglycerate synthase [Myxococcota bacterium]
MPTGKAKTKVLIMGAAGRDFHNFNTFYRKNSKCEVVAFTATQIPDIAGRQYPPKLAGRLYPNGIPIHEESKLEELIKQLGVDEVVFAYSDVAHPDVMHKASRVLAAGADFRMMGPKATCVASTKPVISICAVRTGVGKSQTTRYVVKCLQDMGKKVVAIRHPMPYGDLAVQAVQRFGKLKDLVKHKCTIEEREEYEPHIENGVVVYAGVDYEKILRKAEREADVIIWDGGNNDLPFYKADLQIVLVDPHRPGHELGYHPGEANLRAADVIVINKCDSAKPEDVQKVEQNARAANPRATILRANSPISVEKPEAVAGKKVLVIEDGPTLTHGEMTYGAGVLAARRFGAAEIVDPKPFAVGSIEATYKKYGHVKGLLPAMGYSEAQLADLKATIDKVPCDLILLGTPIDLRRVIDLGKPAMRVFYKLADVGTPTLADLIRKRFA